MICKEGIVEVVGWVIGVDGMRLAGGDQDTCDGIGIDGTLMKMKTDFVHNPHYKFVHTRSSQALQHASTAALRNKG
jgi:hypothetical protein